ncbi:GAF domain-containing protein [Pannus brasiliensis CCIBt3594]|uniref:GAF domain-containing protein n=1 Tax=Pannus brasiliensis CCIBt3594 TaxID=1427578 RepID=A0AAW9R133_9CHRO
MTTNANIPPREAARLEALRQYRILDTPSERTYDDITALAAYICDVPIALISLVDADRQWFKSKVGLDVVQTARDVSFCAHAILDERVTIIDDPLGDPRFYNNPLVNYTPYIRFYAGVPLRTPEGHPIGTLCVIDRQRRDLSERQLETLETLARQVVMQLELKRISDRLAKALEQIEMMEDLIPICSYCKGIRNDRGYWSSVEKFIKSHFPVEFSHGVCDRCLREYFPEVAEVLLSEVGTQSPPDENDPSSELLG